jgi:putative transposase
VSKRVSPTARLRAEIDELFSSDRDLASILEDVARVSVRLMMQIALEAEVDAFLGRERYQRRDERSQPGSRNGHQPPMTVKTTMGSSSLQRPKLRGTDQRFCSRLFGAGVTRTNALESLVISGWVRGRSDRDIEATRPRSSVPRPRCRSRPSAGSARRSVRIAPPGGPATWPGYGWTTCSWTPACATRRHLTGREGGARRRSVAAGR